MAYNSNYNVRERKRELLKQYIDTDSTLVRGMKAARASLLLILFLRLALFILELVYFNAVGLPVNIISNLLLVPMLIILYMIYDGNRGLSSILTVSAAIRFLYLFGAVFPTLPSDAGASIYIGFYIFVMVLQFALTILMTAYQPCVLYFNKMQRVNIEINAEMRGDVRDPRQNTPSSHSNKKKKKKK